MRVTKALRTLATGGATRWLLGACVLALANWASAAPPGGGTTPPPPPAWTGIEGGTSTLNDGFHNVMTAGRVDCWPWPTTCQVIGQAFRTATGVIRYVERNGSAQTVDVSTVALAGSDISLALHEGMAVLAFHNETSGRLTVARRVAIAQLGDGPAIPGCAGIVVEGGVEEWECKSLGPSSGAGFNSAIAVDSAGVVYVADKLSSGTLRLSKLAPPYTSFTVMALLLEESPISIDLAVDEIRQVHLVWATATQIKYAMKHHSQLSTMFDTGSVTVRDSYTLGASDAGRVAIAVNWSERPHIAYTARSSSGATVVRHTYMTSARDWTTEHVSTLVAPVGAENRVEIMLDDDNEDAAAIAFGRSSIAGPASTAVAFPTGSGWGWSTIEVTGTSPPGSGPIVTPSSGGWYVGAVRLDSGKLLVSFYDYDFSDHGYWVFRQN